MSDLNIGFINVLILVALFYLIYTVAKLDERTKGLQYRLGRIEEQVGVKNDVLDEEISSLLEEGKKVEAVKRVRETLGLSLVEAKQYVDHIET